MAQTPRIVLTSGAFDLLHPGHVAFLEAAKVYGDQLVVSVTEDKFVRQKKGAGHPFFPVAERYSMLQSLRIVDRVVISQGDDALDVIRRIKPHVYAKGVEYLADDPGGRMAREAAAVVELGGTVVYLDAWRRYSSTAIMKALA
jgi:D-beta-D-heptose 7-phosphate kinase/D-beta-D-heptose 1-phosphate adenosyltransferase